MYLESRESKGSIEAKSLLKKKGYKYKKVLPDSFTKNNLPANSAD